MDKLFYVYSHKGKTIYSNEKGLITAIPHDMDESLRLTICMMKPDPKECCMIPFIGSSTKSRLIFFVMKVGVVVAFVERMANKASEWLVMFTPCNGSWVLSICKQLLKRILKICTSFCHISVNL